MKLKTLSDYYWKLPKIISIPLLIIMATIIHCVIAVLFLEYHYEFWLGLKIITLTLLYIGCFNLIKYVRINSNLKVGIKKYLIYLVTGFVVVFLLFLIIAFILWGIDGLKAVPYAFLIITIFLLFIFGTLTINNVCVQLVIALFYAALYISVVLISLFPSVYTQNKGIFTTLLKGKSTVSSEYRRALSNLNSQEIKKDNVNYSYAVQYLNHYNANIRHKSVKLLAPFSESSSKVREALKSTSLSMSEENYVRTEAFCSVINYSHDNDDFLSKMFSQPRIYNISYDMFYIPCDIQVSEKMREILTDEYLNTDGDFSSFLERQIGKIIKNNNTLRHTWADDISKNSLVKFLRFGLLHKQDIEKRILILSNRDIILGDAYVENAFLKLMRSDDEDNISDAFDAMEKAYNYHREVEKILVNHLHSSDDDVVSRARRLLLDYRITDWNSITAILKVIDSGSAYDKEGAFKLLARSLPVYVKELETTISEQKQNIIKNVREKATRQCQHDMDADVRQAACNTLESINL